MRIRLIVRILALGILFLVARPAAADSGADIVFVVDQSGSMWGQKNYAGIPNDVRIYRRAAVEDALHRIADRTIGTPNVFRVAVVEFATTARVTLPPATFRYNPSAPPNELMDYGTSLANQTSNWPALGNVDAIDDFLTNTPKAFEMARGALGAMRKLDPDKSRRQAVILITDGRPYVHGVARDQVYRAVQSAVSGMHEDNPDMQLRVLGINDIGGGDAGYWQSGDGNIWANIAGAGHARLIDPVREKLVRIMSGIMDELVGGGPSRPVFANQFRVGPYESRLAVGITLDSVPPVLPQLILPDARAVAPQSLGASPQQNGARSIAFDVPNPPSGTYQIRFSKDANGNATTGQVSVSISHARLSMLSPSKLILHHPSEIVLQPVGATDGDVIALQKNWPIVQATLDIAPKDGGAHQIVPLIQRATGTLAAQWTPQQPGHYTATANVTYRSAFDGTRTSLFASGADCVPIVVSDFLPFTLVPVETAKAPLSLWPFARQSVDLHFHLKDVASGKKLSVAAAFGSSKPAAILQQRDPSGRPEPNTTPIAMRVEKDMLVATIPVKTTWWSGQYLGLSHTIKTLAVSIAIDGKALAAKREYGGIDIPSASGLSRVRGAESQNSAAGFRVNASMLMFWALLAASIVGLALLVLIGVRVFYGAISIRLEDGRRNKAVKLVFYPANGNPLNGPDVQRLDLTNVRTRTFDRMIRFRNGASYDLVDKLKVTRQPGDTVCARARIEYRIHGRKHTQTLEIRSGDGRFAKLPGTDDKWCATLMLEPRGFA